MPLMIPKSSLKESLPLDGSDQCLSVGFDCQFAETHIVCLGDGASLIARPSERSGDKTNPSILLPVAMVFPNESEKIHRNPALHEFSVSVSNNSTISLCVSLISKTCIKITLKASSWSFQIFL